VAALLDRDFFFLLLLLPPILAVVVCTNFTHLCFTPLSINRLPSPPGTNFRNNGNTANKNGTRMEQEWNKNGTTMEQQWNNNGTTMEQESEQAQAPEPQPQPNSNSK